MKAIILKCLPEAKFHFGNIGLDVQSSLNNTAAFIHSDTLFSAIINTAAKIFPDEIEDVIAWFQTKEKEECPEVQVSSAFYMLDWGGKEIFFLPKPIHFELLNKDADRKKEIRKIQFVSKTIWEKGINPKSSLVIEDHLIQGRFLIDEGEIPKEILKKIGIYNFNTRPRIADQTRKEENNFYYQTDLCLKTSNANGKIIQPHFFFLLNENLKNSDDKPKLKLIFDILAEEGIGGRRSLGYGQFCGIEERPFDLNIEKAAVDFWTNISLISPLQKIDQVNSSEIEYIQYYQIITRGGRRTQDKQLHRLKMIKEGALITKEIHGSSPVISDSQSSSIVYRYGNAFLLPIHKNLAI